MLVKAGLRCPCCFRLQHECERRKWPAISQWSRPDFDASRDHRNPQTCHDIRYLEYQGSRLGPRQLGTEKPHSYPKLLPGHQLVSRAHFPHCPNHVAIILDQSTSHGEQVTISPIAILCAQLQPCRHGTQWRTRRGLISRIIGRSLPWWRRNQRQDPTRVRMLKNPRPSVPRRSRQMRERAEQPPRRLKALPKGLRPPHPESRESRILSGVWQCAKRLPGLLWHFSRDARILSSRRAVSALRSFEAGSVQQRKNLHWMQAASVLTDQSPQHAAFMITLQLPLLTQAWTTAVVRGLGGRVVSTPCQGLSTQPETLNHLCHLRPSISAILQHLMRRGKLSFTQLIPHDNITPINNSTTLHPEYPGHITAHRERLRRTYVRLLSKVLSNMAPSPSSKKKSARRLPSYLRHGQGEPVGALLRLREEAQEAARERNRQAETRAASLRHAASAPECSTEPSSSSRRSRGYEAVDHDAEESTPSRGVGARPSKTRRTVREPEPVRSTPASSAASLADDDTELVEIEVEALPDSPMQNLIRSAASAPRKRQHSSRTPKPARTSEPAAASVSTQVSSEKRADTNVNEAGSTEPDSVTESVEQDLRNTADSGPRSAASAPGHCTLGPRREKLISHALSRHYVPLVTS